MLSLNDLIGKPILFADVSCKPIMVILHNFEAGGIWVESDELADLVPYMKQEPSLSRPGTKPVFFVPFAQIRILAAASTEI